MHKIRHSLTQMESLGNSIPHISIAVTSSTITCEEIKKYINVVMRTINDYKSAMYHVRDFDLAKGSVQSDHLSY